MPSNRRKHHPILHALAVLLRTLVTIVALCLVDRSFAHPITFNSTITYSSSQPAGTVDSVWNWSGAAFDAANIGGSGTNADGGTNNGSTNDASTYVANNQPVQGQTFTTGTNANGYDVTSITVRMAGYTSNTATGANVTSWNLNFTNGPILLEIGKASGTTFSTVSVQGFMAGSTGNPGSGSSANGSGTHLTFNLPWAVHLNPNTTYAFDLRIGNGGSNYFEWLGTSTAGAYSGGTAYTRSGSTMTPLTGQRVFLVNMTPSTTAYAPFAHPGALHTQADFDRMKAKVAAGAEPWISDYNILINSPFAQTWWPAYDIDYIIRGDTGNNYTRSQEDAQAIYELALRWKLTGDTSYADHAVQIANVWSGLLGVGGNTNAALASGICGYLFATGGEILSTYPGWAAADKQAYKDMMMRVFYPANMEFLWLHFGTPGSKGGNTHYRLNWDADNIASMAAIGILCDNRAVYQQALDIFKYGPGNGRAERAVWYIHPDGMGQTEEIGRDQPHNMDGWYSFSLLCQMAWNQGDDLFGYDNNRVLRAFEMNAKYNVGNDVLWAYHRNCDLTYTETVAAGTSLLPMYELVYNHYANVMGVAAPYSKQAMNVLRPEPRPDPNIHPSQVDWLGLGSLTFAMDDTTTSAAPSGLRATWSKNQVVLAWWGSATATSYQVQRATNSGGPYTTIGTVTGPNLNFTDTNVTNGASYYYKVTAVTPAGNLDSSSLVVDQALVTRYTFDGNTNDVVGTRNATAMGGTSAPGYATGYSGQAITLNGSDQYVQLPVGSGNYRDITIAAWVYWNGGNAWQRVFDFGSEIEKYMMLTVKDGSGKLNFTMTTSRGYDGTLTLVGPTMPTGTWTHVAVTFNGETATMYVNGVPVAAGSSARLAPLFGQPFCYLGKSMWNSDPLFNGRIDDFRIYNYALTGKEAYALWGQGGANSAPAFTSNPILLPAATQDISYSAASQTLASVATDVNGGTLTFSKISGPTWLTVAGNGALSGIPSNSDVGVNSFVVRVTDSSGASDDANLYVTVNNVNDAPVWSSTSLTKPDVTRDQPYTSLSLVGDASDVDMPYGDALTFTKVSGPAWLGIASNGALSGTPSVNDVGTNVFTVRATDTAGAFADVTLTITVLPFQPRANYTFEGDTADSLGNYPITASGSPVFATGRLGKGIVLDGVDDFLTLPAGIADSKELTVTAWVYWNGGSDWQRIFDFGNSTSQYLFLSPSGGGKMVFSINSGSGSVDVSTTSMPINQWVHVAVTLGSGGGRIYVNGALAATNSAMTISPGDFRPIYNYIGESQFSADPLFKGMIDEFRVYNYALSDTEIAAMMDITPVVPAGVTATPHVGSVSLAWSVSRGAVSYSVKRGLTDGGPYSTIASGLTATNYSDTGLTNGTPYYYVVSATNARGESLNSTQVAAVPSDLLARLKFDETSGTTAADASGNGWNSTLVNSPTWVLGILKNGVNLSGSSQYLTLPTGVVSGLGDFTICTWVKIGAFSNWARIFDFGTGTTNYMFLAPQYTSTSPNNAKLRFAIRTPSVSEQQITSNTALTVGNWAHVAITLSGTTGRMYINGAQVGSYSPMTLNPASLGSTNLNYLGKSQFSADPYLNAALDDFRIYSRALSASELTALASPSPEAPSSLAGSPNNNSVSLTWIPSNGCTSYNVKRATTSGGPYTTVATGLAATSYSDTGVTNNTTYYYVVSGTGPLGESPNSTEIAVTPTSLRLYLKFDETSGTTAVDATGRGQNGTLVNGPVWVAGKLGNAVVLDGSNDYVSLPSGVLSTMSTCTISTWVYWSGGNNWQRLFDFGTGTANYMFLSPKNGGNGKLRFAIRTSSVSEQQIDGTAALATAGWHHVAVVLNGSTGTLYVDGVQVGQNTAMTLNPSSLGSTTQTWIGRSQFSADPYFNGCVDDFRIYVSALDSATIAALAKPLQVTGFAAASSDRQINLVWNGTSGAGSYTLRRTTTSGSGYTVVASGITGTSYTDTGLVNGTAYFYTLTATNNVQGDGIISSEASATPEPPAPASPTGLTAIGNETAVTLAWAASSGATSYNLKRATVSGGPYTTVTGIASTSYTDTGASAGTAYYYVVSAVNDGGESANSSEAPAYVGLPTVWAHTDVGTVAIAGSSTYTTATDIFTVSGSGSDIGGTADSFQFSDRTMTGDGTVIARLATLSNTPAKAGIIMRETLDASSKSVAALFDRALSQAGIAYRNAAGGSTTTSAASGTQTIPLWLKLNRSGDVFTAYYSADGVNWTTLGSATISMNSTIYVGLVVCGRSTSQLSTATFDNVSLPGWKAPVPLGVTASATTDQVVVTWAPANTATSYALQRSTSSGGGYVTIANGLSDTSYTDTGVTNGTTYYYVVTATNSINTSVASAEASARPLGAPTGLTATPGTRQVALTWTGASGATAYSVKRSNISGSGYVTIATGVAAAGYTDNGLNDGTTYYYVVTATGPNSESVASSETSALTLPAEPAGLAATGGARQAALSWTASTGATSYNVKRSTTSGSGYTTVATGVMATSYSDTGLSDGTTYYYVVSAVNDSGESANSPEASALTLPAVPTGLTATGNETGVSLAWTGSSGAASYNVKRATVSGGPYTTIASVTSATCIDISGSAGTAYYYVVSAVGGGGESANSAEVGAYVGLPTVWTSSDVGTVAVAGSSTYATATDTFTVSGSGSDIGGTADSFQFSDMMMTGDGTVIARLATLSNAPAKAGIVMRETLDAGSKSAAAMFDCGLSKATAAFRSTVNGATTAFNSANTQIVPFWLKLSRSGDVFSASYSGDGVNWTNLGSATVTMNSTIYVGLVVCGRSTSQLSTATFDNVSLPGWRAPVPLGVTASATTSQVLVSWAPANTATSYTLQRSITSGSDYSTIASGLTDTSYSDTGVSNGVTYYYVVTATNNVNTSAVSAEASARPLSEPAGLNATPGTRQVALAWSATAGATAYELKRSTTSGSGYTTIATGITATSYTDTGLNDGTTYYYVVAATGLNSESLSSAEVSGLTLPAVPTSLAATGGAKQAVLSWSASSGATSYNVKRSTSSGSGYTTVASGIATATYTDSGLSDGTNYYYVVSAVNGSGESANSTEAGALTIPAAPLSVTAIAGNGQVALSWAASNGATGYNILRSTIANGPFTTIASGITSTSYTDTGLSNGTTYYYSVVATNFSGSSSNSSQVNALTAPAAPSGLAASPANAEVALVWNSSVNAATYTVKRATVSGGPYTVVATGIAGLSYTNTGLTNGTTYYYVVSAVNTGGESGNSAQASATPTSAPPSPWVNADIGEVAAAGTTSYKAGTFTVIGSGANIGGSADEFQYVYQTANGDCQMVARVATIQNTNAQAKSGVMIRETTAAGARHAMIAVTPSGTAYFLTRSTTGGTTTSISKKNVGAPRWLKIIRSGNTFSGWYSSDGVSWSQLGSQTITMGTTTTIGIGVTSKTDGTLCTSTVDNVTATP